MLRLAEIGHHLGRMLQRREAEERRRRLAAERPLHRAEAFFDFVLALLLGQLLVDARRVRPGMRADRMAGRHHLPEDFRIVGGVLADRKEDAVGAFVGERLQHGGRVHRPWAVVESQHDFLVAQEVKLLEMLEAEAGAAGGVDLDGAGDAERVGIVAGRTGPRGRCRRGGTARPEWPVAPPWRLWWVVTATTPQSMPTAKPRLQRSTLLQHASCFPRILIPLPVVVAPSSGLHPAPDL